MAYLPARRRRYGLGQTTGAEVAAAISAAGAAAAPFTFGLSALVSLAAGPIAGLINGCGETCTYSTEYANQAEALLQQNLSAYLAIPVPRTASEQSQAQANFNQIWQSLEQSCSNAQLGTAGQACIEDRENGACDYKTSPGGWQGTGLTATYQYPGANGSGPACWNWFVGYLDPILDDPTVGLSSGAASQLAAVSTQVGVTAGGGTISSSSTWLLLAAALGIVLLVVL